MDKKRISPKQPTLPSTVSPSTSLGSPKEWIFPSFVTTLWISLSLWKTNRNNDPVKYRKSWMRGGIIELWTELKSIKTKVESRTRISCFRRIKILRIEQMTNVFFFGFRYTLETGTKSNKSVEINNEREFKGRIGSHESQNRWESTSKRVSSADGTKYWKTLVKVDMSKHLLLWRR